MVRRIADSVDRALGGVHQFVSVQVITPPKEDGQDEKQDGKMRNSAPHGRTVSTSAQIQQAGVRGSGQDANDREQRQEDETGLEKPIERQAKEVEPDIVSKDWVS